MTAALAFARGPVNATSHSHIALQGYDPVGFFTDAKAVKGNFALSETYDGYTYLFASEAHQNQFKSNPEKYLPAFGGFCAFGVSKRKFVPVDIDTWEIVDGRLILQFSQDVKKKFAEDKAANLRQADANWPKLAMSPDE
ncbi:YHS domain-containing (seleno)protein [Opitutus terrae]|uniref:YHS domain-containing (seleno)protein n=1 Tax=Opitutus terrae TaxID=107709 RepID=UPI00032620DA|nr:YHS domain-containing (seleno)protein [Opitutus terrae]